MTPESGRTPTNTGNPLAALCLIARLHHIAADPAQLAHQLGWPASHKPGIDDLLLAARSQAPPPSTPPATRSTTCSPATARTTR